MTLYIDRSLPTTLVEQIKGQIAYGIAHGDLAPGSSLPSVRELASQLDVAPMTVARVYRELGEEQLLVTKPGVGTFVADITSVQPRLEARSRARHLKQLADGFVQQALVSGHTPAQIQEAFLDRLEAHSFTNPVVRVAVVGNFRLATEAYAREVERILQDLNVKAVTVLRHELQTDLPAVLRRLEETELVIAIPTRLQEIRSLLEPYGFSVVAVRFDVSPATRQQVASIPHTARVGIVATYPEFLTSLLEGVITYSLSASHPRYAFLDQEDQVRAMLAEVDVVVYASGSEEILNWIPDGVAAIEYRHVPDAASLNRLRPLLGERRVEAMEAVAGADGGRSSAEPLFPATNKHGRFWPI